MWGREAGGGEHELQQMAACGCIARNGGVKVGGEGGGGRAAGMEAPRSYVACDHQKKIARNAARTKEKCRVMMTCDTLQ